jgi:hypothetical protein
MWQCGNAAMRQTEYDRATTLHHQHPSGKAPHDRPRAHQVEREPIQRDLSPRTVTRRKGQPKPSPHRSCSCTRHGSLLPSRAEMRPSPPAERTERSRPGKRVVSHEVSLLHTDRFLRPVTPIPLSSVRAAISTTITGDFAVASRYGVVPHTFASGRRMSTRRLTTYAF